MIRNADRDYRKLRHLENKDSMVKALLRDPEIKEIIEKRRHLKEVFLNILSVDVEIEKLINDKTEAATVGIE